MSLKVLFFILLMWQGVIQHYTGFSYIDEILEAVLVVYIILNYNYIRIGFSKYERRAFACIVVYFISGLCSTLINNYQGSISYGVLSGLLSLKSFVTFFGVLIIFRKHALKKTEIKSILKLTEMSLVLSSVLLFFDLHFGFFKQGQKRFGVYSTSFIFGNVAELGTYATISLLLCIFIRGYLHKNGFILFPYIASMVCALRSGRVRSVAFISMLVFIGLLLPFMKKFKIARILWGFPVLMVIAWERITAYLASITISVRTILYIYGFRIALDHFPFGAGFASFGTEFSRRRYSIVYDLYGLSDTYGMSRGYDAFITDTTWAAMLGETGFIGIISLVVFLICLLSMIRFFVREKKCYFAACAAIIIIVLDGIVDSIIYSSRGVCFLSIIALFIDLKAGESNSRANEVRLRLNPYIVR